MAIRVADVVLALAVAEDARLPKVALITAVKAALTSGVARAHPTPASLGKTLATAAATVPRCEAIAAHKGHAHHATNSHASHVMNSNAKTHVARVSTWASSATISTNANRPAMCQQASPHQACPRAAAAAVEGEAAIAVAVVAVVVAHALAAVAGATRAADISADRATEKLPY